MIRGGKNFVSSPPAFSNDAKKLLLCSGNTVSIFSTSTALLIGELEGHNAEVSSVIVAPGTGGVCYCWTASLDGTIRYWDFTVPELMKTIDIGFAIYSMVIPSFLSQPREGGVKTRDLFAYILNAGEKEPSANLFRRIQKCNLSKSRLVGNLILGETESSGLIAISPSGKYIGISEKRKLRIWETPIKDSDHASYKKIRLHHTKSFTTLAFHPTESIIAAGDVTGRILIWRGVGHKGISGGNTLVSGQSGIRRGDGDAEERPGVRGTDDADSCTTWHWHPGQVNLLFFSSDGAYLYSGGREGVLVVWQLDTGKKKFLPRIGSPLLHYISSPDPTMSSISCADNQIHILKLPSLEILRSISGIKPHSSVPEMYKGSSRGIAFDKSSAVASLCTENYCIQFYSLLHDHEVTEVRICERNHQPGDEVTVVVNLVSLSRDGSIMCTVESRSPEEGIGGLQALKFWIRSPDDKSFSLSTVIYDPHRDAFISDIAFHPDRPMVVTSSYGADFKVWVRNEIQQKDQSVLSSGWTCHAVASYKKKQMTAATFSGDGSVLAVAAETVITLWDPDRNILVSVIGETSEPITTLSFVGKSKYLVSASHGSNPQVCLWSMSSLALSWSCKLCAQDIACSLDGTTFAVLAVASDHSQLLDSTLQISDGTIIIFNVEKPVPVATWFARKATDGGLAFVNSSLGFEENTTDEKPTELLAYMNNDREYVLFDPCGQEANEQSVPHETAVGLADEEAVGRFGYASVYGELPKFKLEKHEDQLVSSVLPRGTSLGTLFSGPSHTLPPMTKLCSVFLESLLERRSVQVE